MHNIFYEHVLPFTLVLFRLAGLFIFAPLLGSATIPLQAKTGLAAGFAVALYPVTGPMTQQIPELTLFSVLPVVAFETLIGLVIGLLGALPLITMQMGGHIMGYQMGLSLAQTFNPELETNSDVVGQVFFLAGLALFIVLGGVDGMYIALVSSFDHVPPGGIFFGQAAPGAQPLELFVNLLEAGMELAIRIAAPILIITLLLQLVMGVIMKTMPQINVMTIGFSLKIVIGLLLMVTCSAVALDLGGEEMTRVVRIIIQWAGGGGYG